ncbi:hypothetical protein HMPREF9123_2843 [Neisseria bacilliformis ATCC BAA-1200]|uniref:Uncharacterized protein n=1 Tax=Neisseria bacilliformis ATCC BAA-1200 TaxID=888742 RepID=F2BGI6_9NEIS|nr:hypothetical protein HMPREF9123_2843 [Neisseria bacilliformis ATCC BAA-1200]
MRHCWGRRGEFNRRGRLNTFSDGLYEKNGAAVCLKRLFSLQ